MGKDKTVTAGHICDLPEEVDQLMLVIPGTGFVSRFRRGFRKKCLVSRKNARCLALLHSKAAITLEKHRHLTSYYWVIHPYSKMRTVWEFIMTFAFLLSFVCAPLSVTFIPEKTSLMSPWTNFEFIVNFICFINIFMCFSTGVIDEGTQEIILNPNVIAKKYLFGHFIFDFLAIFPFTSVFGLTMGSESYTKVFHYISLCNLFRVVRSKTLYAYIGRTLEIFHMGRIYVKVLRTFVVCLLFYHWMACICFVFILLTFELATQHTRSWVDQFELWNQSKVVQYAHTYFHAVMSTNQVNYPHGAPDDKPSMILTTLMAMMGIFIFIYFVSLALQILYITNNAEFKYEEDTIQLKEFMRQRQLPETFQKRLIDLNEFKFQKSFFREKAILNSLPGQLQQEILIHSCRHLVENVSFFNNLSSTMLVRLVMVLKSEIYLANQEIIKINTLGDCMYFLASGTIAVYSASGREVCHMQDGSHFGEMALLNSDRLRTASVVALEISEVYRLERKDFTQIVAQFPDMVDQLKQIASERQEQLQRIDV